MKTSNKISFATLVVAGAMTPLLGSVVDLQALQAGHASVIAAYTFEGERNATDGSGTWLAEKADAVGSNLIQNQLTATGPRYATQMAGFDNSTSCANMVALGNGSYGAGLKTEAALTYPSSGTIEYLVKFATGTTSAFVLTNQSGAGDTRMRFLTTNNVKAQMGIGDLTSHDLIGGSTDVDFILGDWYYVVQTWEIVGTTVTLNAWVADLTTSGDLTQTIVNASNPYGSSGAPTDTLLIGGANNGNRANCALDALSVYDEILTADTIAQHFNSITGIPEAASASLLLAFAALIPVLRRRRK